MSHLRSKMREAGLSPSTIAKYMAVIRAYERGSLNLRPFSHSGYMVTLSALQWYVKLSKPSAASRIRRDLRRIPKPPRGASKLPQRPLSMDQWKKLYSEVQELETVDRCILSMLLYSGQRVGDIGRIMRKKIIEAERTKVLDFKIKRDVPHSLPWEMVKKYLSPLLELQAGWEHVSDLVSSSQEGYYNHVYYQLKRCAARVGLGPENVHPHLLRHTFAIDLLEKCGDVAHVQRILGQSDQRTTMRYLKFVRNPKVLDYMKMLDKDRFGDEEE